MVHRRRKNAFEVHETNLSMHVVCKDGASTTSRQNGSQYASLFADRVRSCRKTALEAFETKLSTARDKPG